ncbi:LytTR family DNA-binding domain-containing protein [Tissierella sp. MB52-C2]|uniref:LytR/AlgR family response regulator transcription factor n=1 Tax=Tissierella sp. MB52-C2 TaxID=3070999 RepID=UPI00280AA228|nr:LytTR family DNA-binding domain-containing protein [Tissierella sp. MB52-C2]WMM24857.1 LytTR family DNA-binding domain-containing protein [Tissierella sp. MB52-C2]
MSKILIVEDEPIIANGLAAMINSINSKINITITGYAKEALKYAKDINYDVFLLDIQLKDYSGFELAKEIRNINNYKLTPIVFITAVPTRELMAFKEIHCYDYIVKPFKEETVKTILETIINYGVIKEEDTYLKLKQKEYTYFIKQDEIIYIESQNRKIFISTIKERIELSTYTLSQLLKELNTNFIQCHRGYIVNINYIEKIDKGNNDIYIKGAELPISIGRKYRDLIRSKLK